MYKKIFAAAFLSLFLVGSAHAAEKNAIGTVNFSTCITDSKQGKKEQENLETLRKQMASLIENTDKELKDLASKFEDTNYLDSLSPQAEEDLKARFQALQEDLNRYQGQFYQVMQHANYQMVQKMGAMIANASKKVAGKYNLRHVLNTDACFFTDPESDVTTAVIEEMNNDFEKEAKNRKLSENDLDLQAVDETTTEKAG